MEFGPYRIELWVQNTESGPYRVEHWVQNTESGPYRVEHWVWTIQNRTPSPDHTSRTLSLDQARTQSWVLTLALYVWLTLALNVWLWTAWPVCFQSGAYSAAFVPLLPISYSRPRSSIMWHYQTPAAMKPCCQKLYIGFHGCIMLPKPMNTQVSVQRRLPAEILICIRLWCSSA